MARERLLNENEKKNIYHIWLRLQNIMNEKGYSSFSELNEAIRKERGECLNAAFFWKLKNPPANQYYSPSIEALYVIAEFLDVSVDYLLGRTTIKHANKDININKIGLSDIALKNLMFLHEKSKSFRSRVFSPFYRNPYEKELDALNWILEHVDINEEEMKNDSYDFLTTVYQMVMLRLSDTPVSYRLRDIYLKAFNEQYEYNRYVDLVQSPVRHSDDKYTEYAKEENKRALERARLDFVHSEASRQATLSEIDEIFNGIVTFEDETTYDFVRINRGYSKDYFQDHIIGILDDWHKEYEPIYNSQKATLEKKNKRTVKKIDWGLYEAKEYEERYDNNGIPMEEYEVPDDLLYRNPDLYGLTENEMRLYMACRFAESNKLKIGRIDMDGKAEVYPKYDMEESEFNIIIEKAEREGVGIIKDKGRAIYAPDRAVPTRIRLENLYNRYTLPLFLRSNGISKSSAGTDISESIGDLVKSISVNKEDILSGAIDVRIISVGFFDFDNVQESMYLSESESYKVYKNAKEAGVKCCVIGRLMIIGK